MNSVTDNKIDAKGKSLRDILESKKYAIDYFQREYKWQRKHMEQLLIDLEEAFYESFKHGDSISDISKYNSYFMGPIILCEKGGVMSIIDGQQRLTSLTLILIYINNLQRGRPDSEPLENMIFSRKHGKNSFNIEVEEREEVLHCLFNGHSYDTSDTSNYSIINTVERHNDILDLFPDKLKTSHLPLFIDWLKEKLIFVEILAYSDKNAYTIFETMNDRGYNLTPSEMLKSYLLSKVDLEEDLQELNFIWREQISKLHQYSVDEDLEFFRAWFRGRYAETMRQQTTAGAKNEDFEVIGTSFHRWVKDNNKRLDLKTAKNHYFFIRTDFVFYSNLYLKVKELESKPFKKIEIINYVTNWTIATSLSYQLYLSPITKIDDERTINEKLLIVAGFIDRYVFFRGLSFNSISQTSIRYSIFNIVKKIRGLNTEELKRVLKEVLLSMEDFESLRKLTILNINRKFLKYLLSRLTIHSNEIAGLNTDFYDLITARRKAGNNLHFLLGESFQEYSNTFTSEEEFQNFRGNIGALVLLRKDHDTFKSTDTNILYRLTKPNCLSENEKINLQSRFTLPSTFQVSSEWLYERQNFLIELAKEIWGSESLGNI